MSDKLPRISGKEVVNILEKMGYYRHHQKGSHLYLKHREKPGLITIPMHGKKTLRLKTLKSILYQAGIDVEELKKHL